MITSSRTPEGSFYHCPVCGNEGFLSPSWPGNDVACTKCGSIVWVDASGSGTAMIVKPAQLKAGQPTADFVESLPVALVLDFTSTEFMSTPTMTTLLQLQRLMAVAGKQMRLFGVCREIREVFANIKLDQLLHIYKTREEALSSL